MYSFIQSPSEFKAEKGAHGYDNDLPSMKPIFFARGPNIKAGYKTEPFNSVDIYPLVCDLLGIKPAPNNGTLDTVKSFIVHNSSAVSTPYLSLSLFVISAILGTVFHR